MKIITNENIRFSKPSYISTFFAVWLRSITAAEFGAAANALSPDYGEVRNIRVPRRREQILCFVKKSPNEIEGLDEAQLERFRTRYDLPMHAAITQPMRNIVPRKR